MGSLGNPKTWVPYMINTKDCSEGFCSFYCPQWCYIIFPPPPPPPIEFSDEHKDSIFSPLVVAVIGILASAFILVSYYAIISKYCKNRAEDSSRGRDDRNPNDESLGNQESPFNEVSQSGNNGLDEVMIKSIKIFKFKKEKGFNESIESCSVCLSEFQENESLRLLPKCSHAFHKLCIDTWLKSHSNCPLCRANIVFVNNSLTTQLSLSAIELPAFQESSSSQIIPPVIYNEAAEEDIEMGIQEIEIPENLYKRNEGEPIRRSLSMNDCVSLSHGHLSIEDVLHINEGEEEEMVDQWDGSETSKRRVLAKDENGLVHGEDVGIGVGVRRSHSFGRFVISNGGNKRNIRNIPL